MKKKLAALAAIASLALAGCSTGNQSTDAPPSATATLSGPESATAVPAADLKAEAIASGRPESAWDKNCVTWETPNRGETNQEWANKLGNRWLESHNGAGCPDAIVWPNYYVESWGSTKPGELVIYAEDTKSTEWVSIAQDVMCSLQKDAELENVRVLTSEGEARAHWGRNEMKKTPVC